MRFRGPQALRDTYRKQGVEGSLPNLERPAQVSHEDSPPYSSSFFSHPCALFCIHQKLNSLFSRAHALFAQNQPSALPGVWLLLMDFICALTIESLRSTKL